MSLPDTAQVAEELPRAIRPALAPLKKSAMGIAIGTVTGLGLFMLAVISAFRDPDNDTFVWLIGQNFLKGYAPSIIGAFVGLLWGLVIGFVGGWFIAAVRNLSLSVWVALVGARERMKANRDVLEKLM